MANEKKSKDEDQVQAGSDLDKELEDLIEESETRSGALKKIIDDMDKRNSISKDK